MIIQLSQTKIEETKTIIVSYTYHRNNHNYKYILIWWQFELFSLINKFQYWRKITEEWLKICSLHDFLQLKLLFKI